MKTLRQLENKLRREGLLVCPRCGTALGPAQTYNHIGGIELKGYDKKQWVYFGCVKCDYDWALWKLLRRGGAQHDH